MEVYLKKVNADSRHFTAYDENILLRRRRNSGKKR
jgi:hypothetical protein